MRAARIRAGGVSQAMDALRDQRGLPSNDALVRDLCFGRADADEGPLDTAGSRCPPSSRWRLVSRPTVFTIVVNEDRETARTGRVWLT